MSQVGADKIGGDGVDKSSLVSIGQDSSPVLYKDVDPVNKMGADNNNNGTADGTEAQNGTSGFGIVDSVDDVQKVVNDGSEEMHGVLLGETIGGNAGARAWESKPNELEPKDDIYNPKDQKNFAMLSAGALDGRALGIKQDSVTQKAHEIADKMFFEEKEKDGQRH